MITNQAITGNERVTGDKQPYDALVGFYQAFNNRDHKMMQANWSHSDDCSMSNPLGGVKRGWSEIAQVYNAIFNGPAQVYVEFYDYSLTCSKDMFVAVGKERGVLKVNNNELLLAIRTTRIYCFQEKQWQQVHHHGSMDDPDLLMKYQSILHNT